MKKRLLSLILALAMSLSLAAPAALAAEVEEIPIAANAQAMAEETTEPAPEEPSEPPEEPEEPQEPEEPVEQIAQSITGVKSSYTFNASVTNAALSAVTSGNGLITYYSRQPEIAAVDEITGELTFGEVGKATIVILAQETEHYLPAERKITISVTKTAQKITGVAEVYEKAFKSGGTFQLKPVASGSGKLTYKSSNTAVATVGKTTGLVTMKGTGKAVITIYAGETAGYARAFREISINLYRAPVEIKVSSYYKKSTFYKKLMALKLTGSNRANLIAIAATQLGYHEGNSLSQMSGTSKGSGNYTEYGYVYGIQGAWCAMFVSWCARRAGVSTSVIPKNSWVMSYRAFYQNKKLYYPWSKTKGGSGTYLPKAGDLIFYTTSPGADSQHIGYVKSCSVKSGKITVVTIEGNSSDECRSKTYVLPTKSKGKISAGWYIHGFASPKY